MTAVEDGRLYPAGLLDWAGHKLGGVKKLFHASSGRPSGRVIETPLLDRLTNWARALASNEAAVPRVVLLVGGPGNGKTEAVEHCISALDQAFEASGKLLSAAAREFDGRGGSPRRLVTVEVQVAGGPARSVAIVQDASAGAGATRTPPGELVHDLERFVVAESGTIYLACANRGVLDDALIYAKVHGHNDAAQLIETVISSVGVSPEAPGCWPLHDYPAVAVWPMDVESLVEQANEDDVPPAAQLLGFATDESRWRVDGCQAGEHCPFCTSRRYLSQDPHRGSFLRILRWYELATGKRWTFRDLFSLLSYLLAGVPSTDGKSAGNPCEWAAEVRALGAQGTGRPDSLRLAAPFVLAASQYQHALFGRWPRDHVRALRRDIRDLHLENHNGLMGFYHFLAMRKSSSFPATLDAQLQGLDAALDPAVADPDLDVSVSGQTVIKLRELDVRFSQSVGEGLHFVRRYQCLSPLETAVLQRLDEADRRLGDADVVNRKPAVAARVQFLLRDFACRFVRRSVGVRSAVVRDAQTLADFQKVVEGDQVLLHTAAKQVEALLNEKERFAVVLNTTFGEPVPPPQRRATLATEKQKVRPRQTSGTERPRPSLRFLGIGPRELAQSIPLTFELFRSVCELRRGMLSASLPRAVVALLDTTRARLAGRIVREEALLDGAEIRIAETGDTIRREMESFVVLSGEDIGEF